MTLNQLNQSIVTLSQPPLGINLRSCFGQQGAYVDSFYRANDGEYFEAQKSKAIQIGDIIWSINNIDVHHRTLEDIRKILLTISFPLTLIFHHPKSAELNCDEILNNLNNRTWIGKYIRDVRRVQEKDYVAFVRLHEFFTLQGNAPCFPYQDTSSIDDKNHTLQMRGYQFLYSLLDLTIPTHAKDCWSRDIQRSYEEMLRRHYQHLRQEFMISVIHDFTASSYYPQMTGWAFFQGKFVFLPLQRIVMTSSWSVFLYAFLARYKK